MIVNMGKRRRGCRKRGYRNGPDKWDEDGQFTMLGLLLAQWSKPFIHGER